MSDVKVGLGDLLTVGVLEVNEEIAGLNNLMEKYEACQDPCLSREDLDEFFAKKVSGTYKKALSLIGQFFKHDIQLWTIIKNSDLLSDKERFDAGAKMAESSELSRKLAYHNIRKTYRSLLLLRDVLTPLSELRYEGKLYQDVDQRDRIIESIKLYLTRI